MADRRCFVQFPHPGGEHSAQSGRVWNNTHRWNKTRQRYSVNPHKRKFMQFPGRWIDADGNRHAGDLRAWGEWEPESELFCKFDPKDGGPHHPNYLWKPYWTPRNSYRCLHNTDPFIFGNMLPYSNCRQSNQPGLKALAQVP